jgi:hypothetical protein
VSDWVWDRPAARRRVVAARPVRLGCGVLTLRFRGSRPILNLACGDPVDYDGGTDHIGGTLLAFGLGALIDPLTFNIDKSGLRVFLAEG